MARRRRSPFVERTQPHWLTVALVVTLLSVPAGVFVAWLSPGFRDWVGDLFRDHPDAAKTPVAERIVNQYRRDTRAAEIWADAPALFADSFEVFLRRFGEFDPRRVHVMRPDGERVAVSALVPAATQYSGRVVRVEGRVIDWNVVTQARYPVDLLIQLADTSTPPGAPLARVGSLVYCRVPVRGPRSVPRRGGRILARGLVVASGGVRVASGGFRQMTYLACSSIRSFSGVL
jgi:hypothetical protein